MGDRRLPGLQTPPPGLGTDTAAGDANSSMQPSGNLAQRAPFLSDHPPCLPRTSSPCQSSPPRQVWMNVSKGTQTREQRPQGRRVNGRECPVNWRGGIGGGHGLRTDLLHGRTKDPIALVAGHLHGAQELHIEAIHPAWATLAPWGGTS